jgi:hypothetical protein
MLKNTATYMLLVVFGAVLTLTSCKKDPFSEKDALVAQKELLAQKFSYDLAIANVNLQIQRVGDSARIAIQNLANSGATALEKERLASSLALRLADFNYTLSNLRFQDSLSRIQGYVNSVGGLKSYQIRVVDFVTKAPISNASVKVLPWGAAAFLSVKTNSDGIATFTNIIVDPKATFYAVDDNTGVTSAITMRYREFIDNNPTMEVYRVTSTNTIPVTGTLFARTNLTSSSTTQNLGAGRSVTLTTDLNGIATGVNSAATTTWAFAGVTGTTGAYSITVPRGYNYILTVPSSVTTRQTMFVNFFEGTDNQFASQTRIDSASVAFTPTASAVSPIIYGYYFKLPEDSVSGKNINVRDNAFTLTPSFMNGLLNGVQRNIRSADGTTIDSLPNHYSQFVSNMVINNAWEPSGSNYYNYKVRLSADGSTRIADTLAVEFVNLTGASSIVAMPKLVAITTADGRLSRIETVRSTVTPNLNSDGGRFRLGTSTNTTILASMANRANYTASGNSQLFVSTPVAATATSVIVNVSYGANAAITYLSVK